MKKIFLAIAVILTLLAVFIWQNNNNPGNIMANIDKGAPISGNLKYRFYLFGIVPVGEVTFLKEEVVDYKGQKVYHLRASAESLEIYKNFFIASGILDSYVDMQALSPVKFTQKVHVYGKENPSKEIFYDQKNNTMSLEGVAREISPNTQDPLSLMFNLRHMDLNQDKEIQMNINSNQSNYVFNGRVSQEKIYGGRNEYAFKIIKADITRKVKDPYHRSSLTIVMLRQQENIPILIKVFASGMLITAKLSEAK